MLVLGRVHIQNVSKCLVVRCHVVHCHVSFPACNSAFEHGGTFHCHVSLPVCYGSKDVSKKRFFSSEALAAPGCLTGHMLGAAFLDCLEM